MECVTAMRDDRTGSEEQGRRKGPDGDSFSAEVSYFRNHGVKFRSLFTRVRVRPTSSLKGFDGDVRSDVGSVNVFPTGTLEEGL